MEFARNPAASSKGDEMLKAFDAASEQPLWLVVDAALVDDKQLRTVAVSLNWEMSNALQGSPLESFGVRAPQLLAMPRDRGRAGSGLQRFIALNPQAPAFSVIESAASRDELSRLCAYLAQVTVDADMLLHCRFADVRILPQLLRALSPSQALRVSAVIDGWCWSDHVGAIDCWRPTLEDRALRRADVALHLEMDKLQFSTLLDASEPDTIFLLLLENTPELVPHTERGQFRDRLASMLARADRRQLASPNDRLQFAVLSLSCGKTFDEHPALQKTWADIGRRSLTLADAMKDWSDALWDQLQSGQTGISA